MSDSSAVPFHGDLDWFTDLARTCHMGDTAARLGIPQPTLSRRLSALERRLGARLFDRSGRGLALNDRGRIFADAAGRAMRELAAAEAEIARLTDPRRGPVRLDFMHSLGTWMVPDILRGANRARPDSPIELHQGAGRLLVERVLAGETDLALVGPRPAEADGPLEWTPLTRQRLAIALPAGHRLAGSRAPLRMAAVADEPFIAMLPGYGTRELLDALCAGAGFAPRLVFESMELTTVAGLVSAGLGVALLPLERGPAASELTVPGVVRRPVAPKAWRELGMVRLREREMTPPVAALHADIATAGAQRRWG
ncbi:LysR family transcriptional regulator [Corynebacterium sp. 335C]